MTTLPYSLSTLANGVRLLTIPMPGVNSVATSVMVGVGSRYETSVNNGISHFLEHMVFKGTQKYPTTDDVNVIERMGGLQNAYTDIDITNYHNKVLSSDWKLGLDINTELATKPLLEQVHVDKERDVILEEMKRYEDEPAAKVDELFHTMMYPGTSLGMRIIGEEAPLRVTSSSELKAYHSTWYTPDAMVVVLAGDIGHYGSDIEATVASWFGALPVKQRDRLRPATRNQTEPRVEIITKPDAQQAHFELGFPTFARASADRYAWSVFNLLFGVSFTSRLFREIREKRGLCYHIRSSSSNWNETGYWSIYAGVATDKLSDAVTGVIDEIKKVVDTGVSTEEVDVAKKRLHTMISFKSEDPEFQNEFYGRQVLFGDEVVTLDTFHERIDAVTANQIHRLARQYLIPDQTNLAVVARSGECDALRSRITWS